MTGSGEGFADDGGAGVEGAAGGCDTGGRPFAGMIGGRRLSGVFWVDMGEDPGWLLMGGSVRDWK